MMGHGASAAGRKIWILRNKLEKVELVLGLQVMMVVSV